MKLAALIAAFALVVAILWLAGEQHRENCIREGKRDCSVLPWESGKAKPRPNPFENRHPDWRPYGGP